VGKNYAELSVMRRLERAFVEPEDFPVSREYHMNS
jgi:hypothetical protein